MLGRVVLLVVLALSPAWTQDGSLRVKADVGETELFLDGERAGVTPLTLAAVSAGAHQLVLTKPGYFDHDEQVQIQAGVTAKVFVIMKALPKAPAKLPVEFTVIHMHVGAACKGLLTVSATAVDYRAKDGHDVFHIPFEEVRSLSRSVGPAYGTSLPLQYSACRLETPGRSYGFYAYDPSLAGTPSENAITLDDTRVKTKELFELIYGLWQEALQERQSQKKSAK